MITTLHIKNIGIIDDLNIDLGGGFNVFTGETGAGKTLIIDAINIISGGRFSKEMIRKGEEYSFVELNLYLPEHEASIEGNIIISREIHSNGRNSCKINGRLVTVNELKEFMNLIIDIHGQSDNQNLLNQQHHVLYLDNFAGEKLFEIKKEYTQYYERYCDIKKELKNNLGDDKEKQRKLDLLQYQLDEIDNAKLIDGEEEKLKEKSNLFENAEKIITNIAEANMKSELAVDSINMAIKAIEKISNLDENYEIKLTELKNIYYEIDELNRDLSYMNNDIEFSEEERDEVEERIDLINSLKRKYGNSIKEILEFREVTEKEINRINNLEQKNNELKNEKKKIEEKMQEICKKLHDIRNKKSKVLSTEINKELSDLEMSNARFIVQICEEKDFNEFGRDSIQFYLSTNIGEDAKELSKIASGGEMSRIMLAIKSVLANTDQTPVMIFDEIDTGISGKAAKSVSKKLKRIGQNHQVICITHQPSIAASGTHNYFISKSTSNSRTHTNIRKLNENETIEEIARISNGEITDIALQHATELRKLA